MTDEKDLFSILNLPSSADKKSVDDAYYLYKVIDPNNKEARIAWKILRDDNYRAVYQKTKCLSDVYGAGFFDDNQDDDSRWLNEDVRLLVTPYQKIIERLPHVNAGKRGVILITTGSFSPLHQGHIDMLEVAKTHLESRGEVVVGGYIIPAHDSYVSTKNKGQAGMNAQLRIHLAQLSVQSSDWIMIDGSEALCNPCDRNFTDVVRRIKKYIGYHFKEQSFTYYYVCGADVSSFAHAYLETGEYICIARSGGEKETLPNGVTLIENRSLSKDSSSSLVRSGGHHLLSQEAVDTYTHWLKKFNTIGEYDAKNNFYYHVRYEGVAFYQQWLSAVDERRLTSALNTFRKNLVKILQRAFLDSVPPNSNVRIKVGLIYLDSQVRKLQALQLPLKTISMDQCYQGDYTLGVSRLFSISDGQFQGVRLVPRPGLPELSEQFNAIPDGEYYLVEDDIGSGQTMSLIKSTIPDRIKIRDIILMNKFNSDSLSKEELDIVDMRDFILGSKDGGLVTLLSGGEMVRSIYAYPYVNLIKRAKIPFFNQIKLSRDIWKCNELFFASLGIPLNLSEVYGETVFTHLGFPPTTPVTDICKWHISLLDQMIECQKSDYGIEFYHVYDDEGLIKEGEKSLAVAQEQINRIVNDKKSYCTTLLIDDYRSKNYLLDKGVRDKRHIEIMNQFHALAQENGLSLDFFAFESMMVKIAKRIVKRIPKNLLVKNFYKQKQSYVTMLKNQGFRIGLIELWEDDIKYSCALLSAAWILCRLGEEGIPSDRLVSVRGKMFASKKIITILPKDYESTENKAKVILVSAGYGYFLDRIESIYF